MVGERFLRVRLDTPDVEAEAQEALLENRLCTFLGAEEAPLPHEPCGQVVKVVDASVDCLGRAASTRGS